MRRRTVTKVTKDKDYIAIFVSLATAVVMIYKMFNFVSQMDFKIDELEKSNQETKADIKDIIRDQADSINRNNTELKIFANSTNARIDDLERNFGKKVDENEYRKGR